MPVDATEQNLGDRWKTPGLEQVEPEPSPCKREPGVHKFGLANGISDLSGWGRLEPPPGCARLPPQPPIPNCSAEQRLKGGLCLSM
jgi:hypothetical protein